MERNSLIKFYHQHPLILTTFASNDKDSNACYVCGHPIMNLEKAYVCIHRLNCSNTIVLHKKCGELPNQISHHKHPQHPLHLFDHHDGMHWYCDLCRREFVKFLGYRCSICVFDIDINCEKVGIDALLEERKELNHPGHPLHPLTLMRKAAFSFYCDGCGDRDVDMAYICSICEFWVHKKCALLPQLLPLNRRYHHHRLSLAITFPKELRYEEFGYNCDVCGKDFDTTCWMYFCGDCRFFAHVKCVASMSETTKQASSDDDDGNNVIQLPLHAHDLCKKLITPFVMREKGLEKIPDVEEMPTTVKMAETTARFSFLSNYHKHPLSLVTEFSDEDDNNGDNDSEEEEEEGDAYDLKLKICDVCVSPISSPPYYECPSACKYFVHSTCYLLPQTLSSSSSSSSSSSHLYGDCPKTRDKAHMFTLYTSSESTDTSTELYRCNLCLCLTNGRMYECQGCKMKVDVKCASLPTTVRHAFHRHHKPLALSRIPPQADKDNRKRCIVCRFVVSDCVAYCCYSEGCDSALHLHCALLPKSITKREWDEHPLLLMSDASLDHPSDFYCDFCEVELHPKKPMYHCRPCDHSFHLRCLKSATGGYMNIKFGRRFELDGLHPHPLTFNHITLKKRCDKCRVEVYNYCGLECASCNYAVCLVCGLLELEK